MQQFKQKQGFAIFCINKPQKTKNHYKIKQTKQKRHKNDDNDDDDDAIFDILSFCWNSYDRFVNSICF